MEYVVVGMKKLFNYPVLYLLIFGISFASADLVNAQKKEIDMKYELATLGAGCFWCVEAVFQELSGVKSVVSGYMGGQIKDPTYKQICTGNTGHAEVVQISFDSTIISYDELLEVFWKTHNPTTLNRQGNDVGTQYRSAIFYHNDEQKNTAKAYKDKLNEVNAFEEPIVTEITKADVFYPAELYHQNYYSNNKNQPYCSFVITPKIAKVRAVFKDKLQKAK